MRISEIVPIAVRIPPCADSPFSPWLAEVGQQILVRVRTDEGIVGWGGCFSYRSPLAVLEAVQHLAPAVVGSDPTDIEEIAGTLDRAITLQPHEGKWAAAGIELAAWDLLGKSRGLPVSELLRENDGPLRTDIPVYASLPRYEQIHDLTRAALECAQQGYKDIKLHQIDEPSVAAVRAVVGDAVGLMLDVNCAWSVEDALRMTRRLEPYRLRWLEEPISPHDDHRGLNEVRRQTGATIAWGENELTEAGFQQAIDREAADVYQPSLLKVGGLTPMRRIVNLIHSQGCTLAPHSYYPGPGFAASLHLAACYGAVTTLEIAHAPVQADICESPMAFSQGTVRVPTVPGLGADPAPAVLEQYQIGKDALGR